MLKSYMPSASPMHIFVRQYMRLQFDRERAESYEEKRTMIAVVVRRTNLAIERHARKIHTISMFEQFGRLLIKGTAYIVTEVEKMRKYATTHNNAAKREKWSRVMYEVIVKGAGSEFECECRQFDHMGMLCSHVRRGDGRASPGGDSCITHCEAVDEGCKGYPARTPCAVPERPVG